MVTHLGVVPYRAALRYQRLRREAVISGAAPEVLWTLEHPPVITTGRREAAGVPAAGWLAARGIDRVAVERGGLATWHGPGQLVGYPILSLEARKIGVKAYVSALEAGIIAWLAGVGIAASRREGYPGIWVGRDKICALGVHVHRGVTMHGFALNLCPSFDGFSLINPCGITDGGVTSLERLGVAGITPAAVSAAVGAAVLGAVAEISRGCG